MRSDRGRDIGKPNLPDAARPRAQTQHRHTFARMISAGPGRVISVIGGQDQQIIPLQPGQKRTQRAVKPFQSPRIARHITAMTVKAGKFHEIGKDQTEKRYALYSIFFYFVCFGPLSDLPLFQWLY